MKMNTEKATLAKIIRNRRSVKAGYTDQIVTKETVLNLLDDAVWAPTHGLREPWRFIFVDAEALPSFAKKVASTYKENIQKNRENYLNEPNSILVVIMDAPELEKQWDENFGATASLIQNFSLLASVQGLGVCWKTNPHIYNPKVKEILNVKNTEKIIGFIHLGYSTETPDAQPRKTVADQLSTFEIN